MNKLSKKETLVLTEILEQLQELAEFITDDQLDTAISDLSDFVSTHNTEQTNKAPAKIERVLSNAEDGWK